MIELPKLDLTKCVQCADCVAVCPVDCLELTRDSVPWLPRPLDCLACSACEIICPTEAIHIEPLG